MKKSADYRSQARGNLKDNWGNAILVCLAVLAISTVLSFIPVVGSIASLLLAGQLAVAELHYFIKLHNKDNATFSSAFTRFGTDLISNLLTYLLQTLYTILWALLFIIPGIIKSYSYAMTMFLKAKNPNLGSNEAITLSRQMMDGYKWEFFCLQFSFIGWIILSAFTFGIGFIFLMPYMQASYTAFYEDRYNEYQNKLENA